MRKPRYCPNCNSHVDDMTDEEWTDYLDTCDGTCNACGAETEDDEPGDQPDESMDGDFDSGMASAGFGTDEDYGYYGDEEY